MEDATEKLKKLMILKNTKRIIYKQNTKKSGSSSIS